MKNRYSLAILGTNHVIYDSYKDEIITMDVARLLLNRLWDSVARTELKYPQVIELDEEDIQKYEHEYIKDVVKPSGGNNWS